MNFDEISQQVILEISHCISDVESKQVDHLVALISDHTRVFCDGLGRSGLAVQGFAMRLVHLGKTAFVVSETTTPAITENDLLLICSGSGETESLVIHEKKALEVGATTAVISGSSQSRLYQETENRLLIPADSKNTKIMNSIQPMGTLFEQTLAIVFDTIVISLMNSMNKNNNVMYYNHKNLE